MKNLVHILNELYETRHSYSLISQQNFIKRLAGEGINITAQTLRAWEQHNLITPPNRSGQPEKKGLRVNYCEFALAEGFAVSKLANSTLSFKCVDTDVTFPKYSLLHLEMARRAFLSARYTIPNFPKPPEITYKIMYQHHEELFKDLPTPSFKFDGLRWQLTMSKEMTGDELAKYLFFQSLYSSWFFAVNKGCELFFGDKKYKFFSINNIERIGEQYETFKKS